MIRVPPSQPPSPPPPPGSPRYPPGWAALPPGQPEPAAVAQWPRTYPMATPPAGVPRRSGIAWHAILVAVRHHWLLAALGPVIALGVTAAWLLREPVAFRATATLRIADTRRALTGDFETHVTEPGRLADPVLTRVQLLRSRGLLAHVADSVGLRLEPLTPDLPPGLIRDVAVGPHAHADTIVLVFTDTAVLGLSPVGEARAPYGAPLRVGDVRLTVHARPVLAEASFAVHPREEAVDELLRRLKVSERPQTSIVDVSYTSPQPERARDVVNTLARLFHAGEVLDAQDQPRRRRTFLEEQLSRTDSALARAQATLSSFRSRRRIYSSRERLLGEQRDLAVLSGRRDELEAEREMYNTLYAGLQIARAEDRELVLRSIAATPGLAANPIILQLTTTLLKYRTTRDSLITGPWAAAPTNPDVVRLNQLIESTETQLINAVRSQIAAHDARIGALENQRARSGADLRALPAIEAEETALVQQVEANVRQRDQLREEHHHARMGEAVEAGQVEIVDLAVLPYRPVPALAALKLGLALLLGLVLGGGGAMVLERIHASVHRRDELAGSLHLQPLAIIPSIAPASRATAGLLGGLLRRGSNGQASVSRTGGLTVVSAVPSPGAEAYRMLRTVLLYSPDAPALRTVVITSAEPGEGKTTTATNLAASIASEGLQVLLVDADLWHGRVHEVLRVPRAPGLSECLADQIALATAPVATSVPGLFVLPRGDQRGNPAELASGARMRRLLAELGTRFDLVLLDAPPVLAAADAVVIGALADGVLLVVRAGKTPLDVVQEAVRQLGAVGARFVGAVLNDPAGVTTGYGEKYYQYAQAESD